MNRCGCTIKAKKKAKQNPNIKREDEKWIFIILFISFNYKEVKKEKEFFFYNSKANIFFKLKMSKIKRAFVLFFKSRKIVSQI
jgi:hypothetical protein